MNIKSYNVSGYSFDPCDSKEDWIKGYVECPFGVVRVSCYQSIASGKWEGSLRFIFQGREYITELPEREYAYQSLGFILQARKLVEAVRREAGGE